jgi:transcription termination factor Rho
MSPAELDRSTLDGKDREQLHAIAGAIGVKAPTRMRKAELIDAILGGAEGTTDAPPNGVGGDEGADGRRPRTVRSAKASELEADSIDALAAEQEAIASNDDAEEPELLPRPGRRQPSSATSSTTTGTQTTGTQTTGTQTTGTQTTGTKPSDAGPSTGSPSSRGSSSGSGSGSGSTVAVDPEDERASYGDGNQNRGGNSNRRRRRRGRGGQSEGGGGEREPRPQGQGGPSNEPVGDPVEANGLLELRDEGYGFLRTKGYLPSNADVYVSASQVRRFNLRRGDYLQGFSRPQASNEKYPALLRVDTVNGMTPDEARDRPRFEDLTPLFPDSPLRLELADQPGEVTGRIVDLISPIGKGQRGLIVSPPKAGKTTILKQIVYSVERNNPEIHLMVLLVDERPEEVTDMKRHVLKGEVVASTFDRPSEEHTQVAELTIDRAKRLVEMGKDVVIVLDGITRLARAYNLAAPASGRILSGGVDSTALYPPKRFFGAARNIEEGGSLTIIATALVETGSRMDEVIFEEFKGTGNMELRLDRRISERRTYPAIDVEASSTRHEELLFERDQLNQVWKLRRVLSAVDGESGGSGRGLDLLIEKIRTTKSNAEFLAEVAQAPSLGT